MTALGASFVLNPPAWPTLLGWAAALGLAWEVASLARATGRGRTLPKAALRAAMTILLAPVLAMGLGLYLLMTGGGAASARRAAAKELASLAGRGTVLWTLAALAMLWPLVGPLLTVLACAAIWALRAYRHTTSPIETRTRRRLLALRLAVIALVALWALGPTLEFRHDKPLRPVVLVGLDTSESMAIRDVLPAENAEPVSRFQALREAMHLSLRQLEIIDEQADVEVFAFARSPLSVGGLELAVPTASDATGDATALGDATAAAMDPHVAAGRDVAAVVLVSDGCNNTAVTISPDKLAALLASRQVPIHAVGVGSEVPLDAMHSLTVRGLTVPDEVELSHRLPIAAEIETIGLEGRQIRVTCRFGEQEVDSQIIAVSGRQDTRPVHFVHVPLEAGFHRATVTAEVIGTPVRDLAGEPRAGKLVHVTDRQVRVLYVEGSFRYEGKYVGAALAAGRRFDVERRILLTPADPQRPHPLSDRLEDWLGYDVIVLGDVPTDRFRPKQIELMRRLVDEYGKGLCMIGGRNSFADGGWAASPLADVLGVDLAASTGQNAGEMMVILTPQGLGEEFLNIADAAEKDADPAVITAAWAELRPLSGANRLGPPKTAAAVLATDDHGEPLIVSQRYGKGRTLAVAFDTTWRWVLSPDDTAEMQRRFWRQAVLHLAAPRAGVWIATGRAEYELGALARREEFVEVTAGVEDAAGRPIAQPELTITMTGPDGQATGVQLAALGQGFGGRLPAPQAAGEYRLEIVARVDGQEMRAEQVFDVTDRDLEASEPLANLSLLRRIAEITHGRYVYIDELPALLETVHAEAEPKIQTTIERKELAAMVRWPLALCAIALLCWEWVARRRKGLV